VVRAGDDGRAYGVEAGIFEGEGVRASGQHGGATVGVQPERDDSGCRVGGPQPSDEVGRSGIGQIGVDEGDVGVHQRGATKAVLAARGQPADVHVGHDADEAHKPQTHGGVAVDDEDSQGCIGCVACR